MVVYVFFLFFFFFKQKTAYEMVSCDWSSDVCSSDLLYASGQFPRACERFSRAADDDPASTALRTDVGSCFEGWGWHALREGRPDEALLLFRQGLAETPESTSLLKGLGLAAVHAGRPDDAFGPLERAVRAEFDPEVLLLLAHLYDYREDPSRAIARLEAVLERE